MHLYREFWNKKKIIIEIKLVVAWEEDQGRND